jgi:hypothetical protein
MRDLIFVVVTVGFFAIAAALVAACDRIIGPDPATGVAPGGVAKKQDRQPAEDLAP